MRESVVKSCIIGLCLLALVTPLLSAPQNVTQGEGEGEAEKETEKPPPVLTGNPQIDYIHDPNLPRELKGYDLSDYPFYKRVPDVEFNFTCDDRHDGFYASIPHKCQVYHNCLFGVRYDFLCANYTAFDQANFICHFASEVDCPNSERYYDRNDALYKEATTTTTTTTTTPRPPQEVKVVYVERPRPKVSLPRPNRPNRPRRPGKKGRPQKRPTTTTTSPDYYYYDDYDNSNRDQAGDYYYYDDETTTTTTTTTPSPPPRERPLKRKDGSPLRRRRPRPPPGGEGDLPGTGGRPVRRRPEGKRKRRRRKKTTTTTTTSTTPTPEYYDEYYDDEYYYYDDETTTTTTTTTTRPRRRRPDRPERQEQRLDSVQPGDDGQAGPRASLTVERRSGQADSQSDGQSDGQAAQREPLRRISTRRKVSGAQNPPSAPDQNQEQSAKVDYDYVEEHNLARRRGGAAQQAERRRDAAQKGDFGARTIRRRLRET